MSKLKDFYADTTSTVLAERALPNGLRVRLLERERRDPRFYVETTTPNGRVVYNYTKGWKREQTARRYWTETPTIAPGEIVCWLGNSQYNDDLSMPGYVGVYWMGGPIERLDTFAQVMQRWDRPLGVE